MPQVIENFLERDLSYKLRGCFYNVRNKYGRFHHERIYLVNFGEENFNPRRFIFTNDRKHFISLIKSTDPCIRVNP